MQTEILLPLTNLAKVRQKIGVTARPAASFAGYAQNNLFSLYNNISVSISPWRQSRNFYKVRHGKKYHQWILKSAALPVLVSHYQLHE